MTLPRLSGTQQARIRSIEWIVAALFAALIVALHFVNLKYAGGLWRDEAAGLNLALFPSFGEIWSHLEHESFPLLLTMLLRAWNTIGLGRTDLALRSFGMLVGLAILAALWWNAWRFSSSPPTISMLLFGLSPVAIRWGDSLRAYGLGVFFLLLALGLIWNVVRSPSRKAVLLAMFSGILAVQALYQNIFLLAAFCLGGAVVAVRRGDFKRALLVISVALPAALSLLPYLGVIRRASQWNVATEVPIDLPRIWLVLHRALSDPAPLMFWLWAVLFLAAIVIGCLLLPRRKQATARGDDSELAWFLLTIMLATTIAYYIFLKLLNFPTETWYYLVWMGVMAVAIDALIARLVRDGWARAIRLVAVVVIVAALSRGVWEQATVRMTNLDLVAQRLTKEVGQEDLVLVHPWFCGVTFQRYYKGSAELDDAAAARRSSPSTPRFVQGTDATRSPDPTGARENGGDFTRRPHRLARGPLPFFESAAARAQAAPRRRRSRGLARLPLHGGLWHGSGLLHPGAYPARCISEAALDPGSQSLRKSPSQSRLRMAIFPVLGRPSRQ